MRGEGGRRGNGMGDAVSGLSLLCVCPSIAPSRINNTALTATQSHDQTRTHTCAQEEEFSAFFYTLVSRDTQVGAEWRRRWWWWWRWAKVVVVEGRGGGGSGGGGAVGRGMCGARHLIAQHFPPSLPQHTAHHLSLPLTHSPFHRRCTTLPSASSFWLTRGTLSRCVRVTVRVRVCIGGDCECECV